MGNPSAVVTAAAAQNQDSLRHHFEPNPSRFQEVISLTGSNSLADLAAPINAEHEALGHALKRGLEHAISAGNLLLEAKAQLNEHGKWLPWLREHCQVPERTAQLYMRLAAVLPSCSKSATLRI